uniref:BTB domain-containing protein n=1 Tax=Panagrolaimus sp. PS1159 TaxID=55785 RepID=A0AC35FVQ1_9BILA
MKCKMKDMRFLNLKILKRDDFMLFLRLKRKKLHAHSFILTSVSKYMDAMLTDRWSKKNEVVKIESYSYDNFYQFLCFLYSGSCNVTNENIFKLVDVAEFFGVSSFKKFCDRVLSVAKNGGKRFLTVENVEELTDLALKYSLKEFVDSIREYSRSDRGNNMFKSESFLAFKKPFIEFLISVDRRDDIFFEAMYKWSENQVKKQNDVDVENFNLLEAVKAEMNKILPQIEFSKMSFDFMKNFVEQKDYLLAEMKSKEEFSLTSDKETSLKAFYNNIPDY